MAYTYHGTSELIALPNRTVETYPSGMVRVERSYVCRKADAARNRSRFEVGGLLPNDSGAPAIDGLYIFPAAQETVRDDGFVEFKVSAYGRTNTTGAQRQEVFPSSLTGLGFVFSQITIENCLPSSTALNNLSFEPSIKLELNTFPLNVENIIRIINVPKNSRIEFINTFFFPIFVRHGGLFIERRLAVGNLGQFIYVFGSLTPRLIASSSRNFGFFNEYTTTYGTKEPPVSGPSFLGTDNTKINGVPV